MMLPSLSDIAGKAKRRKGSLSAFRADYESVTSLDILSILAEESLTRVASDLEVWHHLRHQCVSDVKNDPLIPRRQPKGHPIGQFVWTR